MCISLLRGIGNLSSRVNARSQKSSTVTTMNTISLVEEFHQAFYVATANKPHVTDIDLNNLRLKLLSEELDELEKALFFRDPVATLDALTDLQYVLDGAFLALGFRKVKDAAFKEVHRSNMDKLGPEGLPIKRSDGKIMKPRGWKEPDLKSILENLA
jgi:predicted HAD superfamily Cof-like phosphohydrolase